MGRNIASLRAVQMMETTGSDHRHAGAITVTMTESQKWAATKADLDTLEARMLAALYPAMFVQALTIIAAVVALLKLIPCQVKIEGPILKHLRTIGLDIKNAARRYAYLSSTHILKEATSHNHVRN